MRYKKSKEYWPVLTRPQVAYFNPPDDKNNCHQSRIALLGDSGL